jgi:hypothetical protein
MPTDWETLARNHIPERGWDDILNEWRAAGFPDELDELFVLSAATEAIAREALIGATQPFVFSFPGKFVAGFNDTLASALKSANVLQCARDSFFSGYASWASVEAYHVALLAAKALLGMLGVYIVKIGEYFCVLDVFPFGREARDRRNFAKQHGNPIDPAKLIFRAKGDPIEQRHIWTVLRRVLRVTSFGAGEERYASTLLSIKDKGLGRSRNETLYQNVGWPFDFDLLSRGAPIRLRDDISEYDLSEDILVSTPDASFALAKLLTDFTAALLKQVLETTRISERGAYHLSEMLRFQGFAKR